MNFWKNQLIHLKFERKVKLFIEVVGQKLKRLILMEIQFRIMQVQIVIQALYNNCLLISNIDEERTISCDSFFVIIIVSFVLSNHQSFFSYA